MNIIFLIENGMLGFISLSHFFEKKNNILWETMQNRFWGAHPFLRKRGHFPKNFFKIAQKLFPLQNFNTVFQNFIDLTENFSNFYIFRNFPKISAKNLSKITLSVFTQFFLNFFLKLLKSFHAMSIKFRRNFFEIYTDNLKQFKKKLIVEVFHRTGKTFKNHEEIIEKWRISNFKKILLKLLDIS